MIDFSSFKREETKAEPKQEPKPEPKVIKQLQDPAFTTEKELAAAKRGNGYQITENMREDIHVSHCIF